MAQPQTPETQTLERSSSALGWTAIAFAVLQSVCTLVLSIAGMQAIVGVAALTAAASVGAFARYFHQDAIRIPMLLLASLGALANLYVIWRRRSLRARPASQWRQRPLSKASRRSETLQIVLAVSTLVLVAVESGIHYAWHHGH